MQHRIMNSRRIIRAHKKTAEKSFQAFKTTVESRRARGSPKKGTEESKFVGSRRHRPSRDMQAVVLSNHLHTLAQALRCCARLSDDISISAGSSEERNGRGLYLRAFSPSRGAFVQFFFDSLFFESFVISSEQRSFAAEAAAPSPRYQAKAKAVASVFRGMNARTGNRVSGSGLDDAFDAVSVAGHASAGGTQARTGGIDKCVIIIDEDENMLRFELGTRAGIKKCHRIALDENNVSCAQYTKVTPNHLQLQPQRLVECFQQFHPKVAEVSLSVNSDRATLRSYVEDPVVAKEVMTTQLAIPADDFETFETDRNRDASSFSGTPTGSTRQRLIFGVKEIKAFLQFCEAGGGQAVSLLFDKPGEPVVFSTKFFNQFECDLVVATVAQGSMGEAGASESSDSDARRPQAATPVNAAVRAREEAREVAQEAEKMAKLGRYSQSQSGRADEVGGRRHFRRPDQVKTEESAPPPDDEGEKRRSPEPIPLADESFDLGLIHDAARTTYTHAGGEPALKRARREESYSEEF